MSVALNLSTPSAIYDYASLKTEWARRLDRDDLDDYFPQFVQLTENYLKRELRVLDMETTTQLTASAEDVSLPDDFLAMRSIYVEGSDHPDYELRGMSPSALAHEFSGASGPVPVAYVIIGDTLKLAPPPADEVLLEMVYLAKFVPLTETSASNWLIEEHPDVYFYGALAQACDYIQDTAGSAKYASLFTAMVDGLKRARNKDRWGSGPLVPNTVRQVRGARC